MHEESSKKNAVMMVSTKSSVKVRETKSIQRGNKGLDVQKLPKICSSER